MSLTASTVQSTSISTAPGKRCDRARCCAAASDQITSTIRGYTNVRHNRTLAVAACSVVDAATLVVGSAYPVGCVMSGLLIGYARVSTEEQDLTAQRDGLEQLGVEPSRIYVDHALTGTDRERSGLREALAACRAGDTLVVTKLDRLAWSLPDARAIAENLTVRQVRLHLGGLVYDPTDPVGRLLFNVLAMVAESDLIRLSTREGMKVARPKGDFRWAAAASRDRAGSRDG